MVKRISAEELLKQNPEVDPEMLREGLALAERLKAAGFEGARYRLATPLTGRRVSGRTSETAKPSHAHWLVRRH